MKLIYSIYALCFVLRSSLSRSSHSRHATALMKLDNSDISHYDESSESKESHPAKLRYLRKRPYEYDQEEHHSTSSGSHRKPHCKSKCSCKTCVYPYQPCCQSYCMNCMMQPSVLFVPFPVLFMPPNMTTLPGELTTVTASTSPGSNVCMGLANCHTPNENDNYLYQRNKIMNDNPNTERKNDHNDEIRDPGDINEIPKYGIVPIPDSLAVKILSRLKRVRDMRSRKSGFDAEEVQFRSMLPL